jgi:outer membrane protein assembly factor BamB
MKKQLPLAFILSIAGMIGGPAVSSAQKNGDWPQFRGPGGQGLAGNAQLPTKWSKDQNIVWKVSLPGPGASSPVVFGERIYLTCYTGFGVQGAAGGMERLERQLFCLDRDGKMVWQMGMKAKLPEAETIREGHGYATSTPAVDKDHIYIFFGKTGAFAFTHDGKQVWEADLGSQINGWGSANSPLLHGDLVIVNASIESESLVALDRATGKEKWRVKGIRESWNMPIIVDSGSQKELVVATAGKVLGINPNTGEQLWSCATDIGWYMVPGLVASDGVVFCVGGRSNQGLAVKVGGSGDVTRTNRIWTINRGTNVPSPVYHDGHVYWMNDNSGNAYCAELKTGKIVYDERLERANQVYASPILASGRIYYLDRGGKTYVVAAKPTLDVLATNDLRERGDVFNASPAVWGDRLLIRSNKYLFCIGEKK